MQEIVIFTHKGYITQFTIKLQTLKKLWINQKTSMHFLNNYSYPLEIKQYKHVKIVSNDIFILFWW